MPLKTFVKVGNISNLSDARYCAGMGVDLLGFKVIEGQDNYISPKMYQEIRGWVSGPKVVAEIYGINSSEVLRSILENYAPDYFELTLNEYRTYGSALSKPAIVKIQPGEIDQVSQQSQTPSYLISDHAFQTTIPILLRTSSKEQAIQALSEAKIFGVALEGTAEERPGFKDYSVLADVLELLDEY
jgi:phosphoribosylanthranilate isomerase